jgi:hypothetical protein
MHDTIFTFPSPNFASGAAYAHNFWTDEPIEGGASYRLTARRSDGESATAIVKMPVGLQETPVGVGIRRQVPGFNDTVYVDYEVPAGDHLAIFGIAHLLPVPHPCSPVSRLQDLTLVPFPGTRPMGPVAYHSSHLLRIVELPFPACEGREPPETYVGWEFFIVHSGEQWPYSPGDAIGYLGQGSNIQNGQGYLGGIITEKVPIPFCLLSPGGPQYCELFFGPESATLDVRILADGFPVEFPGVQLRKGEEGWTRGSDHRILSYGSPPASKIIWNAPPTIARFPGLEPGVYRVEVPLSATHRCELRSIVLAPGEHRTVEIERSPWILPFEPGGCREG